MNTCRIRMFLLVLFAFALACPASAQELTAGEIVGLFKLGFSEQEIRAEVQAAGKPVPLSPAERQALREAGASEVFLTFLDGLGAPAGRITVAEILALVEARRPVGEILDRIAGGAEPLAPAGAVTLTRAGAHLALVLAMQARPLTVEDLERLGPTGLDLADYRKLMRIVGFSGPLPPAGALALKRAGVPAEIIAEARQAAPSPPPAKPEQVAAPGPRSPRPPQPATLTQVEGGVYTHPGRRFRIAVPEGWVLLRDIDDGQVRYVFTPEKGKAVVDELQVGLTVQVSPLDQESVYGGKSPKAILEYLLPAISALEPGMVQEGALIDSRLGTVPGARALFHGRLEDKQGAFTVQVDLAERDGVVYTAVAMAPRERFGAMRPVFQEILAKSHFGHLDYARYGPAQDESELVARYKGSVVYVETAYEGLGNMGQGTGFIISRSGYVLTNWHVVWDMQNDRPGRTFTIHWDDSLKRAPIKAQLIGVDQRLGRSGAAIGGVDVALLKIPPGDYEPIPLSPSSEARLGDPVLALGFPKSFELTGLSMFITKGVLVRFNRALDGNLESLTTDAKITHGNSGGPCFNLRTGGVLGLNTWGNKQQDYAGYSFLCPIEAALERFPLVADAGRSSEPELDFLDCFELAHLFVGMKGFKDAVRLAGRAVSLKPDSPDALTLLAACQQALGLDYMERRNRDEALEWFKKARAAFERALERDAEHPEALVGYTAFLLGMGELEPAASSAARIVRAHPKAWTGHFLAAQAAAARNQMPEALEHLERAREVTRGIVPQVFILAGNIHYEQGRFDQGRQAFQAAVKLHPGNLGARIGYARSFELEKQWERAIEAYQALLGDFPRHHEVLYRIGLCQRNKGDLNAAADAYLRASQALETAGEPASENFYLEYARILVEKGATVMAVRNLAQLMGYHGASPAVVDAHLEASKIYLDEKLLALASAHYNMAVRAAKGFERSVPQPAFRLQELDLGGIRSVLRFKYPPLVVKDLIENNRLDVNLTGTVEKIARENGIQELTLETLQPILARIAQAEELPLEVVFWMFNSNLKNPPGQPEVASGGPGGLPGGTGPGGPPAGPGPAGPGPGGGQRPQPSPLVGGWEASGMIPYVGYFRSWIVLRPDGTFSYQTQIGQHFEQGSGTYQVQGDVMVQTFASTGQTFHRRFQIQGPNQIVIQHAEINQWIGWTRGSTTPPAWW